MSSVDQERWLEASQIAARKLSTRDLRPTKLPWLGVTKAFRWQSSSDRATAATRPGAVT
jgi:hypothetical protein